MKPVEILTVVDGNGKFKAAVYETETGFTVVRLGYALNHIIIGKGRIHRDAAELIACGIK